MSVNKDNVSDCNSLNNNDYIANGDADKSDNESTLTL